VVLMRVREPESAVVVGVPDAEIQIGYESG
jgi:hypothetical protein